MNFPAKLSSDDPAYIQVCRDLSATQLEALQIFCTKHHQYGAGNIAGFGPDGVLSRMRDDKLNRIQSADSDTPGDSIADNHLDASNYMIIRLMLLRKQWPLPTPIEQSANLLKQALAAVERLHEHCLVNKLDFEFEMSAIQLKETLEV